MRKALLHAWHFHLLFFGLLLVGVIICKALVKALANFETSQCHYSFRAPEQETINHLLDAEKAMRNLRCAVVRWASKKLHTH